MTGAEDAAEALRILSDDRNGKEARHVINVFILKSRVEFIRLFSQRADAAIARLRRDECGQIMLYMIEAAIVSQQSKRFFHRIRIELFHPVSNVTRRGVGGFRHVQKIAAGQAVQLASLWQKLKHSHRTHGIRRLNVHVF